MSKHSDRRALPLNKLRVDHAVFAQSVKGIRQRPDVQLEISYAGGTFHNDVPMAIKQRIRGRMVKQRESVTLLPTYVQGKSISGAIKLSSNENPYPPLESVAQVVRDQAASIQLYPAIG